MPKLQDHILEVHLPVNLVLGLFCDSLFQFRSQCFSALLLNYLKQLLASKLPDYFSGGPSFPVPSLECMDQELQEHIHLGLTSDNQIDIPVLQLKRNAVPTVERH